MIGGTTADRNGGVELDLRVGGHLRLYPRSSFTSRGGESLWEQGQVPDSETSPG